MRVISGYLKGKKLEGINLLNTRPTMDRIKESVFATINYKIKDAVILDLLECWVSCYRSN